MNAISMVYGLAMLAIFLTVTLFMGNVIVMFIRKQSADLHELTEAVKQIAASKRLSTYLDIERKSGLAISPEQFEANKPALEARMLAEIDEQITRDRMTNPSHAAYEIINRSSFRSFVETRMYLDVLNALERLLANKDIDGAKQFVRDAVAAL
ncbi:MAG: hypothetical protein Q7S54_00835 [bacterium]|nr:hypothetical protein [bacterium]